MDGIFKNLNSKQAEAVQTINGPVLIIAGAGSGKTRALTHRLAYLLANNINPENILALTFTNKAAEEMRERVGALINPASKLTADYKLPTFIGTFHSLGAKILRQEMRNLDRGNDFIIYDDKDSLALVKESMAELAINDKQFKAPGFAATISDQKNELIDARAFSEKAKEFYEQLASRVFLKYENYLTQANAVDFDDLILLPVKIFKQFPLVLEKYQNRYQYILVDEYQDTNQAQYVFLKLLAQKNQNICVVGDDWQCFPPKTKILTPIGQKAIANLLPGDKTVSANGLGLSVGQIKKCRKFNFQGKLIKIITSTGQIVKVTPNHIFFTRFKLNPKIYFVYLMYAAAYGYRIGVAKGARSDGRNIALGLHVRANQERADKMWVLKITATKAEAKIQEHLLAIKYGIPTLVFSASKNRSMRITQKMINKLYNEIPTRQRVLKLMEDLQLHYAYPHFLPQGTTRKGGKLKKIRINLTLFGDPRITNASPWGMSRLAINTSDVILKKALTNNGFPVRKGKNNTWRIELSRLKYIEAEKIANQIYSLAQKNNLPVEFVRNVHFAKNWKRYVFQPASHLLPGMLLPMAKNGRLKEIEINKIEREFYRGPVYDLDIPDFHNYMAEGIVTHNSIYGFRKADFRNILNFEKDYPKAKIVLLEENYRSSQNILDAAHGIIEKNIYRTNKKLWTKHEPGEKIKIMEVFSENEEAEFITQEINQILRYENHLAQNLNDFVILYRTNAQSRSLEEAILEQGWPYQVVGAFKFYERKEIKDIISYLRAIQNPCDFLSWKRIINVPPRGLGKVTQEKFLANLGQKTISVIDAKTENFLNLIAELKNVSHEKKLTDFIQILLEKISYKNYTLDGTPEGESRWENIQELLTVASKFNDLTPPQGLISFLEEVALIASRDDHNDQQQENNFAGKINLMTLHSAKGLEFPVVFITGAEEGLLPHSRSFFDPTQLEEERRLCYVGLTRAKKRAYFTFAQRRNLYGKSQNNPPSRFLGDMPERLIDYKSFTNDEEVLEI